MEGADDVIIEAIKRTDLVVDEHLITAYVLIVETMDGVGDRYLKCDWTEGIPIWSRDGMLDHAKDLDPDMEEEDEE